MSFSFFLYFFNFFLFFVYVCGERMLLCLENVGWRFTPEEKVTQWGTFMV